MPACCFVFCPSPYLLSHVLTRGNKNASIQFKICLERPQFHKSYLAPAASATFTLLLTLYKRAKCKRMVGYCRSRFPPLCKKKKKTPVVWNRHTSALPSRHFCHQKHLHHQQPLFLNPAFLPTSLESHTPAIVIRLVRRKSGPDDSMEAAKSSGNFCLPRRCHTAKNKQ